MEIQNTQNFNQYQTEKLNLSKLLIFYYFVLELLKKLVVALHMDKLFKHQKDSTELSWYDKYKYQMILNKDPINHINQLPSLEQLKGWAESGKTKELQYLFYLIQDEYNQRAKKLKEHLRGNLIDYQQYLKNSRQATQCRCAVPTAEKYLKEVTEELEKAKSDLKLAEKQKNKTAIDFGKKEVRRLGMLVDITKSEIATLKKDYTRIQNNNAERVKLHYQKVREAQKQWNNLLVVLFNWVYLEDQWRIACEEKAIGEFSKIFTDATFQLTEETYLFLCFSGGYYGESTVGILRKNYGKLEEQVDYTDESDRQTLTIFDESDKHRKGAMRSITRPNKLMNYSNLLDCLSYMQTMLTKYNENAQANYRDFNTVEGRSAFLIWLRGMIGLAPNYAPDEKAPNSELTDFILPSQINRVKNPYENQDIKQAQYDKDYIFSQKLGKRLYEEEPYLLSQIAEVTRHSPSLQDSLMNLSHDPDEKELCNALTEYTAF